MIFVGPCIQTNFSRRKKKQCKTCSSNYTAPDIITANSPLFDWLGLVAEQFAESSFRRLGVTLRLSFAGLGWLLLRCLFSLLFRRGVGLLHGGRQVCLGRRGTRLRLRDRRRRLHEKVENGALLRHVCELLGCINWTLQRMLSAVSWASLHHLAASYTARVHLVRGKDRHGV